MWLVGAAIAQAIGSIAAIGAGFGVLFLQQKHAKEVRYRALFTMVHMTDAWAKGLNVEAAKAENVGEWRILCEDAVRSAASLRPLFDRIDIGAIASEAVWSSLTVFWVRFDDLTYVLGKEAKYGETHMANAPIPEEQRALVITDCTAFVATTTSFRNDLTGPAI